MVQGHGDHCLWTRALASHWIIECPMWGLQVHFWPDWLLFTPPLVQSAWFQLTEVASQGVHHLKRSHLWLLPKIPLWAQLHWAVLGCSQVLLPVITTDFRYWCNGEECSCMPWWCSFAPDQTVRFHPSLNNRCIKMMGYFRFANRSAWYISAYGQGLSGSDAAWANRRYHGHRTLPPSMAHMAQARGVLTPS